MLSEWIVAGGELDRPRPRTVLQHVGLRARAVLLGNVTEGPGKGRAVAGEWPTEEGPVEEVRGVARPARDFFVDVGQGRSRRVGAEFVLDAGSCRVLGSTPAPAYEVREGTTLTFRCVLSVVADYEWDGFGLPDVRQDWTVRDTGDIDGDYLLELEPVALPGR